MVNRSIALFGTLETAPTRIELTAGPISATFENGALRWIRLGDVEVLRGIAFLVRDRRWDTPSPLLSDLKVDQTDRGFRVTFKALCRSEDGELPWSAEIVGAEDGTLRFVGTASPANDFVTNRTGFVVLHPLERVVGCPVEVTHVDGNKRRARFPEFIDPEQCFFDVRALSHEVAPGVWATCTMEGDSWEMEDHRNWLDASFKTYVRPLALPYPYTIAGGSSVTQTATLGFSGTMPRISRSTDNAPVHIALGDAASQMPAIGLRAPLQWMDEAQEAIDLVREAGPQLLNGRFDPRAGHGVRELRQLGALAKAIGASLTLELVVPCRHDPSSELTEFAAQLRDSGVCPESIAVAVAEDRIRLEPGAPPPSLALLGEVYRAARAAFPDTIIGGGSFGFFTELNRNWPPLGLIDYVAHVVCSVVHASDDRAMMENIDSFQHMTRTIRAFAGNLPYRLIASGLGLDIGPYGPPAPNPDNTRRTMVRMDPRHRGLFGATWTLASIAEAARAGLQAISPAALVGELGIVHRRLSYDQPWFDHLGRAGIYPIYHVVSGLAHAAGRPCIDAIPSDRTRIAALSYRESNGETNLWLANLRDKPQQVLLPRIEGDLQLCRLDETTFELATTDPKFLQSRGSALSAREIDIGAYGITRIQIGG